MCDFINTAAEKTIEIGSGIKERGAEKLHQAEETFPVVAAVSEKSKQAFDKVNEVSNVSCFVINRSSIETYLALTDHLV